MGWSHERSATILLRGVFARAWGEYESVRPQGPSTAMPFSFRESTRRMSDGMGGGAGLAWEVHDFLDGIMHSFQRCHTKAAPCSEPVGV